MLRATRQTKALGVDRVSKEDYGKQLKSNLENLVARIRKGTYKPQVARIVEIPKDDGSTRPLAISCTEDKLVQMRLSEILGAIYEPIFLPCSFGFRPGKSAHDALRKLTNETFKAINGAVVEIDLRRYFNSIPHGELLNFIRAKISDRKLLNLIETCLRAPTVQHGVTFDNELGSPQGSILSPVVSNIFLHHVVDEWFRAITNSHFCGQAEMIRYADDLVFIFRYQKHAERFFDVLPKRLGKYGLSIHWKKSQLLPSGTRPAEMALKQGKRLGTYRFLGFTCYWGPERNGRFWRLKYKSRSDRRAKSLRNLKEYLRSKTNPSDIEEFLKGFIRRVKGWVNYHAISDNGRHVNGYLHACRKMLIWWFRRRSGRYRVSESTVDEVLRRIGFTKNFKTTSMFPHRNAPQGHRYMGA